MTDTLDTQVLTPNAWIWNSQAPPPLTGQVRTDSRDWLNARQLHVDRKTDGGTDVGTDLAAIKAGDELRLEHQTDATRYVRFMVGGPATLVTNAYVFPVTMIASGGTIPNSGTRILLTLLTGSGVAVNWTITAARDPNRYWITCVCLHGRQAELMAMTGSASGSQISLVAGAVVPTTASNLRRRFGCTCNVLTPALAAAAEPEGYTFVDVPGYTEVGSGA